MWVLSDDAWETVVYLRVLKHACFTYLLDMLDVGHQLRERTKNWRTSESF
jgi:hypothetical protein